MKDPCVGCWQKGKNIKYKNKESESVYSRKNQKRNLGEIYNKKNILRNERNIARYGRGPNRRELIFRVILDFPL